jgi:hypothetical protein
MGYRLRLYPYSGCGPCDLTDEVDLPTCRRVAACCIRDHRKTLDYPVTILERGSEWELETGEDAFMISDGEGILAIEEVRDPDDDPEEGDDE